MQKGTNGFSEMKRLIEFRLDQHDKRFDTFDEKLEDIQTQLTKLNNKYTILQTKMGLYVTLLGGGVVVGLEVIIRNFF